MKFVLIATILLPTAVMAGVTEARGLALSGEMNVETRPHRLLQSAMRSSPSERIFTTLRGTAHEPANDQVHASNSTRDGDARSPQSDHGTEWLHAFVVEAMLNAPSQSAQPFQGRLIAVPDRLDGATTIMVNGEARSAAAVRSALQHQLARRMMFEKPKDPYVADLLYSYAVLEANLGTIASAVELLGLAREYGFPDESLLARKERRYKWTLMLAPIEEKTTLYATLIVAAVLLFYVTRKVWSLCRP